VIKNADTNETLKGLDDLEIYFMELPKRESVENTRLQKWMALLSSNTWEEMKRNAEGDDIMRQVYEQAKEIAMNESQRIEVLNRKLYLIGENSIKQYEREQGKIEMAKELLKYGIDVEIIARSANQSIDEIEKLKKMIN